MSEPASKKVVTRFAPSPTGFLHAGNYRTAIFAYLYARREGGTFIVRIEDTDRERSKAEYEQNIFESLEWLGLEYDARYRQSEQVGRHEKLFRKLIDEDKAYVSQETPKEAGQRAEVIRFRNPNIEVTFRDMIRGDITFDTTELGDFIIGKSITEPLYHFGVVVDDMDEGVTHVIRGEDHISNTTRQILIQRALGAEPPVYAHLPLVLAADRAKLSKRRGARALTEYRDAGFIPEAVTNYLALLGWHPEGNQELFSREQLVAEFDLARIQKSGAIFDEKKLRWFNKEHLRLLTEAEYARRLKAFMEAREEMPPAYLAKAAPLLQERAETLADAAQLLASGEFSFFEETLADYDAALLAKGAKVPAEEVREHLTAAAKLLADIDDENWSAETVKSSAFPYADAHGRSAVLWPLRIALSGAEKSPDPFTIAGLIGRDRTLVRIAAALKKR